MRWFYNYLFIRLSLHKKHYELISIDLSKQQVLDADPKAILPISFTGNLKWNGSTTMFFIIEEATLDFSKKNKIDF